MDLIELYIQEVVRRLPEKDRHDVALELQSKIEDKLPDGYTEQDVKVILVNLGDPVTLASGYRDRPMHLIGPRYYDVYITLLKMILPVAIVISLIALIGDNLVDIRTESILKGIITIFSEGLASIIGISIQVFFWLTFIFAILERTDTSKDQSPLTIQFKKWTPEDLKQKKNISKKKAIPKNEIFLSLMGFIIFSGLYIYAGSLLGIYENTKTSGLVYVTPTFNQDVLHSYWLLVFSTIILGIILALYKLLVGQWTLKLAIFNAIFNLVSSIIFIIIISNPNLFNDDFITYMSGRFSTIDDWQLSIKWVPILTYSFFSILDSYQGFQKARIH